MLKITLLIPVVAIIAIIYKRKFEDDLPEHFGGYVDPGFESVEHAFRYNFEQGLEPDGAAFAVCHNGKLAVDLWGGYADKTALRTWKDDTITTVFSATKGASSLCIALLVDRGYISYDDLVIKYWPEFGAHGKDNITVKMLVSHEAGLAVLDKPITPEVIRNWRLMSKMFEDQVPDPPPGTALTYHAFTHGWLCDQLIRRVDPQKRNLSHFFQEEIAKPYGIDFFIGLPRDQLYRVARMRKAGFWDLLIRFRDWNFFKNWIFHLGQNSFPVVDKSLTNPDVLSLQRSRDYFGSNSPDVHELEIPAANGIGTARALARMYCLLADRKKPLLSRKLLENLTQPTDRYLLWGFGHSVSPHGNHQIGHAGYGGQMAKFDLTENLAFSYLRNNMAHDMGDSSLSFQNLQKATYESIKKLKKD